MSDRPRCLIIGISDYPKGITRLPAVASDVHEITALLTSDAGAFTPESSQVITDRAAHKDALMTALRSVFESAGTRETIFVYIAGHGYLAPDELFYFLPYDFDRHHVPDTGIPLSMVRSLFDNCASENVLLWLDFCHSGGILARGPTKDVEATAALKRALEVIEGRGKVIMCACTSDQSAYEDADHGHFTKYLIKGLKGHAVNNAGEVTVNSLHDYIDKAMGSTRQRPMFFGTLTGRIVLMHSQTPRVAATESIDTSAPVSTSGAWVMLGTAFFKSTGVQQTRDGKLCVRIPGDTGEDDARIRSLLSENSRRKRPLAYAFRNDGLCVEVEDIASESGGDFMIWTITLRPIPLTYGGGFLTDIALDTPDRHYTADDIAELRGKRLLLNQPPPLRAVGHSSSSEDSLDAMVRGLNTLYPVEECIFRALFSTSDGDVLRFLQTSRLAAIFALKASQVFEHVIELSVGPVVNSLMHVNCRGKRREVYSDRTATVLRIEGDVILN